MEFASYDLLENTLCSGAQAYPTLCSSMYCIACQAHSVHGLSKHEYWSRLPFPTPGELPNPEIKPLSVASPALQTDSLPLAPPEKPGKHFLIYFLLKCS